MMDRQQVSWLIIRAFGLYLLVQAFILLPEMLAGLFAARYCSNVMSSLGSEGGTAAPLLGCRRLCTETWPSLRY
jgi:hypothetical protein